jgi:hypothetical protein
MQGATRRSCNLAAGNTMLLQTNGILCRAIVVSIKAANGSEHPTACLRAARDRPSLSVGPGYCSMPDKICRRPSRGPAWEGVPGVVAGIGEETIHVRL